MECARIAAALDSGRSEVVVFDRDRCFVVAASDPEGVLHPRRLTDAERRLRDGADRLVTENGVVAVGVVGPTGALIGSMTTWTPEPTVAADVWHGLSRQVTAVIGVVAGDDDFHRSILQGLRDAVIVLDEDLTVQWASEGVGSLVGRTPAEIIGRSATDFLHADDVAVTVDAIARFTQGLEVYRVTIRISNAAGGWVPVEVTGVDLSNDDNVGGMVLSLRYADYESELGSAMDRVQRMATAVVDGLHDGIVATNEFGAVSLVNDVAREMFGIDPAVPPGSLTLKDFPVVDDDGRPRALADPADAGAPCGSVANRCVISPTGEIRYARISVQPVVDDAGDSMGEVVIFEDVTSERQTNEELHRQAYHDQLTGLANRRLLESRLDELAKLDPPVTVAACFVDLDGFKIVNDNHGHRTGDRLIRVAAERLRRELSEVDLLVRQGGDEFVALLVDVDDVDEAVAVAERCVRSLGDPYRFDGGRFDVTASIGVAVASSDGADAQLLLQHADIALYAAKHAGRNRVERFDDRLAEASQIEALHRQILHDALEHGRVVMHFQPLVDIESSRTVGYEALARIRTTDGEVLGPSSFMDAVANTGLMWDLDSAGFAISCDAVALMQRICPDRPPRVACNFSSVSLTHPDFLNMIAATVAHAGIEAEFLCIEITESAAYDAGPEAIEVLRTLQERGHPIALDDFGTGYSSLAHLRDLPISSVKVDRSFIIKLTDNSNERAIVEAVVTLANDLGLGLVAEGVETQEHLDQVEGLGFSTVQGWHYSPALTLTECLSNWRSQ